MWQEAEKSGTPSASPGGDTYHCLEEKSRTREASVPQKGRHAAEVAPEVPERAARAPGAEVMKRERMLRLALFRKPQRGPRHGEGGRSPECSNLTAGPQLSQLLKQGRHKSRNSRGWWGSNGASWVSNLGLPSCAFTVSAGGWADCG